EHFHEIMRILMEDPNIDAVVNDLPLTFLYRRMALRPDFKAQLFATLTEMRDRYNKPLLAVVGFSPFEKEEVDMRRELLEAGVPAFHNFERAARAFRNASNYHRFRARIEDDIKRQRTLSSPALAKELHMPASLVVGSQEHKELFCRFFIDTHVAFDPATIAWPTLDEDSYKQLHSLPVWAEAIETERM